MIFLTRDQESTHSQWLRFIDSSRSVGAIRPTTWKFFSETKTADL